MNIFKESHEQNDSLSWFFEAKILTHSPKYMFSSWLFTPFFPCAKITFVPSLFTAERPYYYGLYNNIESREGSRCRVKV